MCSFALMALAACTGFFALTNPAEAQGFPPIPTPKETKIVGANYVCWDPKSSETAFAFKLTQPARLWQTIMSADKTEYYPEGVELSQVSVAQARTAQCSKLYRITGLMFARTRFVGDLNGCTGTFVGKLSQGTRESEIPLNLQCRTLLPTAPVIRPRPRGAGVAAAVLRTDRPITCQSDRSQNTYEISVGSKLEDPHTRVMVVRGQNAGRVELQQCIDTTKNNETFGVPGGELSCFDRMASARMKVEVVLKSGMAGEAGQFKLWNLQTTSLADTGTCRNR